MSFQSFVPALLLAAAGVAIPAADLRGAQVDPPPDPWLRITVEVAEDGRARSTFEFASPERVPDSLRVMASGEQIGEGVQSTEPGGLRLRFAPLPLEELGPLLAQLPEDRSEVHMLVRIARDVEGADIWEFQGLLSAQRIRRVRFETDGVPLATHTENP